MGLIEEYSYSFSFLIWKVKEHGMEEKELRWVRKAKKGNQKALNKLLKSHYSRIYTLAYSYVKNESDSLDVVQEAAFRAATKLPQLRQEEYFSTWLNRIVMNEAKRLLVRRKRDEDNQVKDDSILEKLPNQNKKIASEFQLLDEIHELEKKYQEILLSFYFNDLSIREIADLLEVNENTVKTRLVRGREQLKKRLILMGYEREDLDGK